MGYANSLPYQMIELYTGVTTNRTITTVSSDANIADFVIPDFTVSLSHAYLDWIINRIVDLSGAANYLENTGSYGIVDTGATYRAAVSMNAGYCTVAANADVHSGYMLTGTMNIYQYITPGVTQTMRYEGVTSHGDSLILGQSYGRLRLFWLQ